MDTESAKDGGDYMLGRGYQASARFAHVSVQSIAAVPC